MSGLNFTWVDFVIIGLVLFSTLISIVRGFVREALSLASWILAFWVAITFSGMIAGLLENYISNPQLRTGVAFFSLFALTLIIGAMINFLISQVVKRTGLSGTDRMLGMIFGMARGGLIVSLLLLLGSLSTFPQAPWWQNSATIPAFKPVSTWLKDFFPDNLEFSL